MVYKRLVHIVDPSYSKSKGIISNFKTNNYDVEYSKNPVEAVHKILQNTPDFLITELGFRSGAFSLDSILNKFLNAISDNNNNDISRIKNRIKTNSFNPEDGVSLYIYTRKYSLAGKILVYTDYPVNASLSHFKFNKIGAFSNYVRLQGDYFSIKNQLSSNDIYNLVNESD